MREGHSPKSRISRNHLRRNNSRLALGLILVFAAGSAPKRGLAQYRVLDPVGDAMPRPMDPGTALPFSPAIHRLPDLLSIEMQRWAPTEPFEDLFVGESDPNGAFLRLQLVLLGLMNPPGPTDLVFDPFRYGPHPVFGFVEIDMDNDADTGGEIFAPQYRYLGNVARFGGHVLGVPHRNRFAADSSAFDGVFESHPQVERHGEEFHLALLGEEFTSADVHEVEGDGDLTFEAGETWVIHGSFFHRAHGYEPFSFVEGGRVPGEYAPLASMQFKHATAQGVTFVTLVFPLTHEGAALMYDEPLQPTNHDPADHASVLEALEDLQLSAFFLPILGQGLPEEALLVNWAERDPSQFLNPATWSVTAILGSSFTARHPNNVYFLWSDIFPNVVLGDINGSGEFDGHDRQLITLHIAQQDQSDGEPDGVVTILDFAVDFSMLDINHDGLVNAFDLVPVRANGDTDEDGDIDLVDFAILQQCLNENIGFPDFCGPIDIVPDMRIDIADLPAFWMRWSGPGGE